MVDADLSGLTRDALTRTRDAVLVYSADGSVACANDAARDTLPSLLLDTPAPEATLTDADLETYREAYAAVRCGRREDARVQFSVGETAFDARLTPLGSDTPHGVYVCLRETAVSADERVRELAILNRVVRHDVRNDASLVVGWAEMLDGHVDAEGEEYLSKVLCAGDSIVELTEAARDYARTVTDADGLGLEPTSLRDILESELALRKEAFPDAEFAVTGDLPDVTVAAHPLVDSVFRNLLNNAVQHNDTEHPVVTVACEVADGEVEVRVADNGPGVPDGVDLSGDSRVETRDDGSGVGLSLVRALTEAHGGSVEVRDNDPRGAVFVVRLPLAA